MKWPIPTIGLLCVLLASWEASAQVTLDLTSDPAIEPTSGRVEGRFGMIAAEGLVHRPLPLAVTLVSIEPRDPLYFQEIVWEITLKNNGSGDITIPWSDPWSGSKTAERNAGLDIEASIVLVMTSGPNQEVQFAGELLFGNRGIPGTVRVLRPGDEVRIRGKGQAGPHDPQSEATLRSTLPREVSVRANLFFTWGIPAESMGVSHMSSNSLLLALRKRD